MLSLSDVLRKYAEQGDEALLPAADEIAQHGYLAEYLHKLLEGDVTDTDAPPVAYQHPNGFTKIRLASLSDSGWSVRVHVWTERSSDRDVHSHRWNFASRVLSGNLTEKRYQLIRGTGGWEMYRCAPSVMGLYSLQLERECDIRLVSEDLYRTGGSYQRDADILHTAHSGSGSPTVTIFVQGSERTSFTTVVRPADARASRYMAAPMCSSLELARLLREVVSILPYG